MSEKILVLDDEKEIAEVIALYLRNEGYEVEVAHTGLEVSLPGHHADSQDGGWRQDHGSDARCG